MIERLTVLCFAGTYGLALLGELARFVTRNATRWYVTVALTALGWGVHTAYLANRAWRASEVPLMSGFESLLVLAWILAAIALYLILRSPKTAAVGLFVLPLVVALVVAATTASRADWTGPLGVQAVWGTVHGLLLLGGAVSTCVAFAAGLMYLVQANRLKHKRLLRLGFALPSLEQSERLNRGAITVAFPLLTFGLLSGLALNLAATGPGSRVLGWTDPKVLSTGAMWLVFAALLHARYRPEWRGQRVMLLTVVAFAFLIFSLVGVGLILPTAHGVPPGAGRPS